MRWLIRMMSAEVIRKSKSSHSAFQ